MFAHNGVIGKMLKLLQGNAAVKTRALPAHVAIIMDGNGRWAKQRHLPRTQGHIEGVKRVEEIADVANRMGIQVLTLYTFSTENWQRPKSEVSMLMNTLASVLSNKVKKLAQGNMRFQFIGQREGVPEPVLTSIDKATRLTQNNTGLILNMAFNYGSRLEILDAVRQLARRVASGELSPDQISEETMSQALYTRNLPDPDLLIRTSGEKRISNFLLWQLSYAELYFTDTHWPDFNEKEFLKAIADFQSRERRFGRVQTNKN